MGLVGGATPTHFLHHVPGGAAQPNEYRIGQTVEKVVQFLCNGFHNQGLRSLGCLNIGLIIHRIFYFFLTCIIFA